MLECICASLMFCYIVDMYIVVQLIDCSLANSFTKTSLIALVAGHQVSSPRKNIMPPAKVSII